MTMSVFHLSYLWKFNTIFQSKTLNICVFRLSFSAIRLHESEAVVLSYSVKKLFLRNFAKFTGKHPCQSLFFYKVGLRPATLLNKSLWHRCFPVNFAKFLRTSFLKSTFSGCLWRVKNLYRFSTLESYLVEVLISC